MTCLGRGSPRLRAEVPNLECGFGQHLKLARLGSTRPCVLVPRGMILADPLALPSAQEGAAHTIVQFCRDYERGLRVHRWAVERRRCRPYPLTTRFESRTAP